MVVTEEMEMIPMIIRTGVHQLNFTLIAGVGEGAAVFGRLQVSIAPCSIKIFLHPEDLKQFPSLTKAPLSLFHLILSLKKLISWLFLCLLFVCFPGRANGDSARLGGISPPRKTRSSRSKRTRGGFSQRSASCFLKQARDLHRPEEPEVL